GAVGLESGAGAKMLQPLVGGIVRRVVEERGIVLDDACGKAERMVELSHPLRVAFGQIIVDRDQMSAFALEGIEIDRKGRDQGLSLTCLHFGDAALMENHAANELHVEMAHVQFSAGHLPTDREGFRENIVKGVAGSQALLEGLRVVSQGMI